ncbi:Nascent polypeptide-associated complex protein [Candidatus Micrarchaeota archaeon]|nr:Nascent polypeptide-associated complex protein [Candidatus Micrarchaeota archaeon]
MSGLMKQMGIKTVEVDAKRVIVEKNDGTRLVVDPAQVTLIDVSGQKMLQVAGTFAEENNSSESSGQSSQPDSNASKSGENDVELVMKQANVTREAAQKALDAANGDIAQAILDLSS